jgi:mannosyltransferase OCH1-like enzyme
MIPKILSQTWKSEELPAAAARLVAGWRRLNPDFEHRFYDDAGCREVVASTFPEHLGAYDALPRPVMRADVFRYAVVYRDGGLYADIDMECLKPIAPVLTSGDCILSVEARLGATRQAELGYATDTQIANCIFAAVPGHPFLRRAVNRCFELFAAHDPAQPVSVEDITGPRMLTRLLDAEPRDDVTILPQVVLMAPFEYPDIWPVNRHMYARHRTFGTWKDGQGAVSLRRRLIERNRLPNPLPAGLDFLRREKA